MRFVINKVNFESGNHLHIKNTFLGSFKTYDQAKKVLDEAKIKRLGTWVETSVRENKLCECCGEIEAYVDHDYTCEEQLSIYKSTPH